MKNGYFLKFVVVGVDILVSGEIVGSLEFRQVAVD
jgi:hypothetical protein